MYMSTVATLSSLCSLICLTPYQKARPKAAKRAKNCVGRCQPSWEGNAMPEVLVTIMPN